MIVVGLTGSMGMGKSTVTRMFADLGAATWSADDAVHRLYGAGGAAVAPLAKEFPEAIVDGAVDRDILSRLVLDDPARLKVLEMIVHPLVALDRAQFLADVEKIDGSVAVLDIPLLLENNYQGAFDAVIVVSAPEEVQRARVLGRPGMTEEKYAAIIARQMPDAEKRARADYVIFTDQALDVTRTEVETVLADLKTRFAK